MRGDRFKDDRKESFEKTRLQLSVRMLAAHCWRSTYKKSWLTAVVVDSE